MESVVNVKVVEDDSVQRKLECVADKLHNKYYKTRKIDKRLLKKRPLFVRICSKILNVVLFAVFSLVIFFAGISVYNKVNNMPSTFLGVYSMQVVTTSMVASGFEQWCYVTVRAVDTDSLKPGDIIAFYQVQELPYAGSHLEKIEMDENADVKFQTSFSGFFGIMPKEAKQAASKNTKLVFHHIREVYRGEDGLRYFKTYGSSNATDDDWLISEKLIVGSYDNSPVSRFALGVITKLSSAFGLFLLLLIPVAFIMYSLIRNALVNLQYSFLENDIVEEKRKLTDEICVKNGIGYRMSKETKYKVLAQAPDNQKLEYINLLWKTGNRPENIRKYYLRKGIVLRPLQKLRDVNRNCEQMFKDGVQPVKIAKYYTEEKEKIQAEQKRYKALVRKIGETHKAEKNGDLELATTQNAKDFKVTIRNMRGKMPKQTTKPSTKPTTKMAETAAKTATKKPKADAEKPQKSASTNEMETKPKKSA